MLSFENTFQTFSEEFSQEFSEDFFFFNFVISFYSKTITFLDLIESTKGNAYTYFLSFNKTKKFSVRRCRSG